MELNDTQKVFINKKLDKLETSKFRSSFHLKKYMIEYINDKGLDKIEKHCEDFINKNLEVLLPNDGKQTPTKNHPVFIAQHATATCCRECLEKWHNIPKTKILDDREKKFIKALIMEWINKELKENI